MWHTVGGRLLQAGSPFRQPLMKFLLRYPEQSVELFLSDGKVQDQQWNRFFEVLHTYRLAAWLSDGTSVSGWQTFPVLRSTCS